MSTGIDATMSGDERLWRAVIAGDTAAFRSVVDRYQGAVSAIAFSVLGDFAASQDVAQETFWGAWKSREQLREPQRLGSWLCSIARNLANDWRRRNPEHRQNRWESIGEPVSNVEDPAEQSISAEEEAIVWNSLQELPENYREVLALYYRQGNTVEQVSLALNLSEDAVKQRLSRGRTMLREQVATLIEDVLVRSRPGKKFTTKVMAGIAGLVATAQAGGTVSAATTVGKIAGGAATGAASGAASVVAKSVLASSAGFVGGLLGAAGGLGGAYLGSWLPAELAPTQTERMLLHQFGRRQFRMALIYTVIILAATPLLFVPRGWIYYVGVLIGSTLAFILYVTNQSMRAQRMVRDLRANLKASDDPNLSGLKRRMRSAALAGVGVGVRMKGRSYSSQWKFLSLPLVDIQIGGFDSKEDQATRKPKIARGWIAIGDHAHGILLGIGGYARGIFAFGGMALGAVSIGGLSIGLISVGGLALGLLSLAGLAAGHTAVGGCSLGWNAVGGVAVGWNSAAGGLAVANHAAIGGLAVAREFAVGGQAIAAQANTPAAKAVLERESLQWIIDWIVANQFWFMAGVFAISFSPLFLSILVYRFNARSVRELNETGQ